MTMTTTTVSITTTTAMKVIGMTLAGLLVGLGCNKSNDHVCSPANTWSQPVFNCPTAKVVPAPEPDPEPEPEPAMDEPEPESKAVLRGNKIEILEKVQFATGSAEILDESFALLDEVAAILEDNKQVTKLRVEGHTDSRGGKRFNRRLSKKRAAAVRRYLIDKGIDEDRLSSKGYGSSKPIADNKTEEGRSENRRVEFNIIEGSGVESE